MHIRFHNTLSHRVEAFDPLDPPRVSMYNCGPTVYDFAHIGNFRSFIFADLLRRFLEFAGYEVVQVMNITDVGHMTEDQVADGGGEDKMAVAVRRLKEAKKAGELPEGAVDDPSDPYQIADFYTQAFLTDARALGLKVAEEYPERMPRATRFIAPMQAMVRRLLDNGHAYVADDGAVYYSVESFPGYGRLSGNTLERLRGGAGGRVTEQHQAGKRHPADFLLWKPDASHIMKWDSPWGAGYPGWHIECSAMATALHGREVIDIHTGGEDNIFPHHECEIAQTCGATENRRFARFWMHSRYLLVEGEKMSKSKGNFFTVRDVLQGEVTGRRVHPAVLRYELMRTHYRTNVNFTRKGLADSASAVRKLSRFAGAMAEGCGDRPAQVDHTHPAIAAFGAALADDLNISGALAEVFKWIDGDHPDPAESLGAIRRLDRVLGVVESTRTAPLEPEVDVAGLCRQIDEARAGRDFATADRVRGELIDAGYEVTTTREGTSARKKLA